MNQEKMQDIALMRYSAISPIITGLKEDYASLDAFFRAVSDKGIVHPDGHIKHYAPATIETWYRKYLKHGFDALLPTSRADHGQPRKLDADLKEQIAYLKTNYPRMSSLAIFRQLQDNGSITNGQVSQSTAHRYINQLAAQKKTTVTVQRGY